MKALRRRKLFKDVHKMCGVYAVDVVQVEMQRDEQGDPGLVCEGDCFGAVKVSDDVL